MLRKLFEIATTPDGFVILLLSVALAVALVIKGIEWMVRTLRRPKLIKPGSQKG